MIRHIRIGPEEPDQEIEHAAHNAEHYGDHKKQDHNKGQFPVPLIQIEIMDIRRGAVLITSWL